jgi:transmembrane sensor
MTNQEIQALLLRYRSGECSLEEITRIHLWYESLNESSLDTLNEDERELIEKRMLQNIRTDTQQQSRHRVYVRKWWMSPAWYSGVAAALILSLSYVIYTSMKSSNAQYDPEQLFIKVVNGHTITHENNTNVAEKVILEDKSIVTLSPGSRIIYPKQFSGDKRDVQLIGDAFFEIAPNPKKPFLVYSGKLVTRVLGTSFRIKTDHKSKALEVEVVTGKVSVFENNEAFKNADSADVAVKNSNGVVLTPNQRVIYFPDSRHLMTGLVMEPIKIEVTASTPPKLEFNNVQLSEIVGDLENEYGIEIVFANDRLEKCTFTGDVSDMALYEKLDLLCKSNQASYEVKGTRILINGDGCD